MNCRTCVHWKLPSSDDSNMGCDDLIFPHDRQTWAREVDEDAIVKKYGYRVRYCTHPKVVFYSRPDRDGAAVFDGSDYMANFVTAEDFGCVLHTAEQP